MYAIESQVLIVGVTATQLRSEGTVGQLVIHNEVGGGTVYLGNADVTVADGIPILAGQTAVFDYPGRHDRGYRLKRIYLIAAAPQNVRIGGFVQ